MICSDAKTQDKAYQHKRCDIEKLPIYLTAKAVGGHTRVKLSGLFGPFKPLPRLLEQPQRLPQFVKATTK